MEHDNMYSLREVPWHGLGIVVPEDLPVREAQRLASLDWKVRKLPVYSMDEYGKRYQIEGQFAIQRTDLDLPLGIVGSHYEPYQNDDMFKFMEVFCDAASTPIETCGSLRNGKIVWALAKSGSFEYIAGDPVEKYFLVRNTHDGSSKLEILFTDVRVVCNNTLSAALRGAVNRHSVTHTANIQTYMENVSSALKAYAEHAKALAQAMQILAHTCVSQKTIVELTKKLTNSKIEEIDPLALPDPTAKKEPDAKAYGRIVELVEVGQGTDIPGVKGTLYGWVNAVTEYADHYKPIRRNDLSDNFIHERRFETSMYGGTGYKLKQKAFDLALKQAA
jgi:phage/plasmid-like protein (TIGR03299 family)